MCHFVISDVMTTPSNGGACSELISKVRTICTVLADKTMLPAEKRVCTVSQRTEGN